MGVGRGEIISGNEQYLSVRRIRYFGFAFFDVAHRRRGAVSSFAANHAVVGHSMSRGIKQRQPGLHRLLLAVAFNYFN